MIERVHIVDDWMRDAHQVLVIGRPHPGAPRCWLRADGQWEPLKENVESEHVGFHFPAGTLDALVAAYRNVTPTQPASERHLEDAIAVRDRLLSLVEKSA